MQIFTTLQEMLSDGDDWNQFCEDKGFDIWAINEGYGHVQVVLTLKEAQKYGLVPKDEDY